MELWALDADERAVLKDWIARVERADVSVTDPPDLELTCLGPRFAAESTRVIASLSAMLAIAELFAAAGREHLAIVTAAVPGRAANKLQKGQMLAMSGEQLGALRLQVHFDPDYAERIRHFLRARARPFGMITLRGDLACEAWIATSGGEHQWMLVEQRGLNW